jgi:tartrate dehydrogenase/decarboxylase/D-malate dehydrogenase
VTSATKSNGIIHSMPYWDERFAAMSKAYPDIRTAQYHIDILTAHFVQHPDWFDVVVASNLFGDILSDLGPAIAGSIGIAPGANINPEKEYPSMFEPVHGSAPALGGKNIANPMGAMLSAALMLEYMGLVDEAQAIESAVRQAVIERQGTRDIGGSLGTRETGDCVASIIQHH